MIETRHFEFENQEKTIVIYEYPADYEDEMEKHYTTNDEKNNKLADEYRNLAKKEKNVIFGGN